VSSVASASLRSEARVDAGRPLPASAAASAVAVGLVVVSAVLELGATHWGIALVALPLLVANVVLARLAYPALERRADRARIVPRRHRARRRGRVERRRELGDRRCTLRAPRWHSRSHGRRRGRISR
jgi:hypothetical protein